MACKSSEFGPAFHEMSFSSFSLFFALAGTLFSRVELSILLDGTIRAVDR